MTTSTDAVQHNKEMVRSLTEHGFNDGDLSGVDEHFRADYQVHAPGVPPLPSGPHAFKRAVTLFRTAMPDIHVTIEDLAGEGDRVFGRFTTRGTHTGPLMGIPPSGKPVTIYEWVCHRFVDGKVAESWIGDNVPRILLSIGAVVARGPAAAVVGPGGPPGPGSPPGPGGPGGER
jgi:predicted ester cyclase